MSTSSAPVEQPRVGRDPVALLDQEHVAGHEPRRVDDLLVPVAQDPRLRGQVRGQRLDRALGLQLLGEREARVDHDHDDDRDRHGDDAGRPGERRGRPEQQRQRMGELARQLARPAPPAPPDSSLGPCCRRRRSASRDDRPDRADRRSRSSRSIRSVGSS